MPKLTFPNESPEYRKARVALLEKEIELRRAAEAAAKARRELPPGGVLPEDYVFETFGPNGEMKRVKLSELFGRHNTLGIYSYMFGPERKSPCPMCTGLLDAMNAVHPHLTQRLNVVAIAESPLAKLQAFREERGWEHLPLLSTGGSSSYNAAYGGKENGQDTTMFNIFHREGSTIRHFWAAELSQGPSDPGQDHRGLDILNPIFAVFDMTPEGRGSFYTKVEYGTPA